MVSFLISLHHINKLVLRVILPSWMLALTFYFCLGRIPKYAFGSKLNANDATAAKLWQHRRLRDPNPVEDVPEQDSAENLGTKFVSYGKL